ncbi:hypothetical protein OsJ_36300 [Oryza sativa Japonica Group]|uniref:Uncharacterized protein n=1 Tax=Oryza sativa subsp. japonica TaxID=39947 RepID=B9GDF6_ORYSJ|nr:hypothetical protein OsJ_36300 [Oryza sativa Japonica Group]
MEDQAWLPIRDAALLPLHLRFPHQCRGPPSATIVTVDMPRKRMAEAICMLHELKLLSVSGTGWILLVKISSVAYLQQIWWFEVVGKIDFSFPVGTYSLYFRIHLGKFYKRFGRRV